MKIEVVAWEGVFAAGVSGRRNGSADQIRSFGSVLRAVIKRLLFPVR
jgi:hypothetical protein